MENERERNNASARPERVCPVCEIGVLRRVKREGWTARVPFSKSYGCPKCRANFLRVFDSVQFKIKKTAGNSRKGKRELAIVTLAIFATIYVCYRIVIHMYESGVQ